MLWRYIVPFGICSFLLLTAAPAQAQTLSELEGEIEELHEELDASQERLSETRRKMMEEEQQLDELREREDSILQVVERYEEALEQTRRNIRWLRQQEQEAQEALEEVTRRQRETERELEALRTRLGKRLRAMYMEGNLSHHRMLLGAESSEEFLVLSRYYRELVSHDRELLERFAEEYNRLEELRRERQSVVEERRDLRERVEQTEREERNLKQGYEQILADLREEKELHRRRLRELENQQQELHNVMNELRDEESETQQRLRELKNQFSANRGELPWPVDSREVLRDFGTIQEGGVSYDNPGIDIAVEAGAPVRAVGTGTVVHVGTIRGRGQVVILQHDENHMTVYGSLIEISVESDQQLEAGDQIGRAGRSSGFEEPHLHFQVVEQRELHDPLEWLR